LFDESLLLGIVIKEGMPPFGVGDIQLSGTHLLTITVNHELLEIDPEKLDGIMDEVFKIYS